jgi:hypothetical protein
MILNFLPWELGHMKDLSSNNVKVKDSKILSLSFHSAFRSLLRVKMTYVALKVTENMPGAGCSTSLATLSFYNSMRHQSS